MGLYDMYGSGATIGIIKHFLVEEVPELLRLQSIRSTKAADSCGVTSTAIRTVVVVTRPIFAASVLDFASYLRKLVDLTATRMVNACST